jgi:hypothetical protein
VLALATAATPPFTLRHTARPATALLLRVLGETPVIEQRCEASVVEITHVGQRGLDELDH